MSVILTSSLRIECAKVKDKNMEGKKGANWRKDSREEVVGVQNGLQITFTHTHPSLDVLRIYKSVC